MHLSMHNWMRAEPIEVTIRRLAKYGYESIEISGEPEKYDTKEVRKLLNEYGLRCWGSVTLMFAGLNFPSADEATRARTVKYVKDCITMVKELDGEEMTIVPGTVGKVNADSTPEKEWAWAVDRLKEVYAYGQQAGVRLALEPLNRFETYFISRGAQALALAEAVGPDAASVSTPSTSTSKRPTCWRPSARRAAGWSTSTSPTTTAWPAAWARSTGAPSCARSRTSATTAP